MELMSVVARIGLGAMDSTWSEDGHKAAALSPPEDVTVSPESKCAVHLAGRDCQARTMLSHCTPWRRFRFWCGKHQPSTRIVVARTQIQSSKLMSQGSQACRPRGTIHRIWSHSECLYSTQMQVQTEWYLNPIRPHHRHNFLRPSRAHLYTPKGA